MTRFFSYLGAVLLLGWMFDVLREIYELNTQGGVTFAIIAIIWLICYVYFVEYCHAMARRTKNGLQQPKIKRD